MHKNNHISYFLCDVDKICNMLEDSGVFFCFGLGFFTWNVSHIVTYFQTVYMYSLEHKPKSVYYILNKSQQKPFEKCEGVVKII